MSEIPTSIRRELLGTVSLLCGVYSLTVGPFCGYDILRSYELKSGAVYPSINAQVNEGLINETDTPEWHQNRGGKEPRYYGLTSYGLEVVVPQLIRLQVPDLGFLAVKKAHELA